MTARSGSIDRRRRLTFATLAIGAVVVALAIAIATRSAEPPASSSPSALGGASPGASPGGSITPTGAPTRRPSSGSPSPSPSPPPVEPVRLAVVSGDSPFAACLAGLAPGDKESKVQPGAEVEPFVAVDPADPDTIVVAWQQDRWTTGAARGLVTGVSHDGGRTWQRTAPTFSTCSGGTKAGGTAFGRASDPWVAFSPSGVAFQTGLVTLGDRPSSAILVSLSTHAGDTWSAPRQLIGREKGQGFNDKESVTADPFDARRVFAIWDRTGEPREPGEILLASSLDGGATWGRARVVAAFEGAPIGNQIVALPDGALVDVFDHVFPSSGDDSAEGPSVETVVRSTDGGRSWSKPIEIARAEGFEVRYPGGDSIGIRSGWALPDVAVDPRTGRLFVTWTDGRFGGGRHTDIALATSSDGGRTWSDPVRANLTPEASAASAFTPSVHVTDGGTIGLSYFDFRNDEGSGPLATDYFLARSTDGGATWTETRLTAESFDLRMAPTSGGLFLGDYMGLASAGERLVAAFVRPTGDPTNPTEVVVAIVEP